MGVSYIIKGNWHPKSQRGEDEDAALLEKLWWETEISQGSALCLCFSLPVDFIITTHWSTFYISLLPQLEQDQSTFFLVPRLNKMPGKGSDWFNLGKHVTPGWRALRYLEKLFPLDSLSNYIECLSLNHLFCVMQILMILLCTCHFLKNECFEYGVCFLQQNLSGMSGNINPSRQKSLPFIKMGRTFCSKSCIKCYCVKNI